MSIFYIVVAGVLLAGLLIAAAATLMVQLIERYSLNKLQYCPTCGTELHVYWIHVENSTPQMYVECPLCHRQSYIKDDLLDALKSLHKDPLH